MYNHFIIKHFNYGKDTFEKYFSVRTISENLPYSPNIYRACAERTRRPHRRRVGFRCSGKSAKSGVNSAGKMSSGAPRAGSM